MENRIEIQIIAPNTRAELRKLIEEIGKLKTIGKFTLHCPPSTGRMGESLEEVVVNAWISGSLHTTVSLGLHYILPPIIEFFKKSAKKRNSVDRSVVSEMRRNGASLSEGLSAIVTCVEGDEESTLFINADGERLNYSDIECSIDPMKTSVILFGNSVYEDKRFIEIKPAAKNIEELSNVLNNSVKIPIQNIEKCTNFNCIQIKNKLNEIENIKNIDTVIIYFAGHGEISGDSLSLIASDTKFLKSGLHNDIEYSFLEEILNDPHPVQKILILDCCHSGLASQNSINRKAVINCVSGSIIFSSSSANKSSYFNENNDFTFFTSFLIDILENGESDKNKKLSIYDIYDYTRKNLKKQGFPESNLKPLFRHVPTNKLLNPKNIFICSNPSYSLEGRIIFAESLYENGSFDEGRRIFDALQEDHKDGDTASSQIFNAKRRCDEKSEYVSRLDRANKLFYQEKNFARAKELYQKILLKSGNDIFLSSQLLLCEEEIKKNQPREVEDTTSNIKELEDEVMGPSSFSENMESKPEINHSKRGVYIGLILLGVAVVASIVLLLFYVNKNEHSKVQPLNENEAITELKVADSLFDKNSFKIPYSYYLKNVDSLNGIQLGNLSQIFEVGDEASGIAISLDSAVYFNLKAANLGNLKSCFWLGNLYYSGYGNVPKNYNYSIHWFELASKSGDSSAMYNIGLIYFLKFKDATDSEQLRKLSLNWMEKAKQRGFPVNDEIIGTIKKY